jgi:hypothetical protein
MRSKKRRSRFARVFQFDDSTTRLRTGGRVDKGTNFDERLMTSDGSGASPNAHALVLDAAAASAHLLETGFIDTTWVGPR